MNYADGGGRNHKFEEKSGVITRSRVRSIARRIFWPRAIAMISPVRFAGGTSLATSLETGEKGCNSPDPTVARFRDRW